MSARTGGRFPSLVSPADRALVFAKALLIRDLTATLWR
jgi:hypothetical protein